MTIMDLGNALTLAALVAGGIGGIWAFGVFVGQLRSAIAELSTTVKELREALRELREDHNNLREEVAEIKGTRRGRQT